MEYKVMVGIVSGLKQMYWNDKTSEEQDDLSSKLTSLAEQGWRIKIMPPTPIVTERVPASKGVEENVYTDAIALTILLEKK